MNMNIAGLVMMANDSLDPIGGVGDWLRWHLKEVLAVVVILQIVALAAVVLYYGRGLEMSQRQFQQLHEAFQKMVDLAMEATVENVGLDEEIARLKTEVANLILKNYELSQLRNELEAANFELAKMTSPMAAVDSVELLLDEQKMYDMPADLALKMNKALERGAMKELAMQDRMLKGIDPHDPVDAEFEPYPHPLG